MRDRLIKRIEQRERLLQHPERTGRRTAICAAVVALVALGLWLAFG